MLVVVVVVAHLVDPGDWAVIIFEVLAHCPHSTGCDWVHTLTQNLYHPHEGLCHKAMVKSLFSL